MPVFYHDYFYVTIVRPCGTGSNDLHSHSTSISISFFKQNFALPFYSHDRVFTAVIVLSKPKTNHKHGFLCQLHLLCVKVLKKMFQFNFHVSVQIVLEF